MISFDSELLVLAILFLHVILQYFLQGRRTL